jgi:hypothetical protein
MVIIVVFLVLALALDPKHVFAVLLFSHGLAVLLGFGDLNEVSYR